MSAKPENSFRAGVNKYVTCHHEKMHNAFRGGTFDDWYSGKKADLWVEYKFVTLPKRDATIIVPNLSPLQVQWGRARHEEGRSVWVIVGCKEGGMIFYNPDEWERGVTLERFREALNSRKDLATIINKHTT